MAGAGLLEAARRAISDAVPPGRVGVAFSGGVDSTLLARLCADMGYGVSLLTVGFAGSADIAAARRVGGMLGLEHRVLEIDPGGFAGVASDVCDIVQSRNISWQENAIAFHYVSELASGLGISTVAAANGIDELFCGYNAYLEAYAGGEGAVLALVAEKMDNELRMMERVRQVASRLGVRLVQPLLSRPFAEFAATVPLSGKIRGPGDMVRKHAVREAAREAGVPEESWARPKKALQYGSGIHRSLLKIRRAGRRSSGPTC